MFKKVILLREEREERREKTEYRPQEAARGPQMRPPEVPKREREADGREWQNAKSGRWQRMVDGRE